MSSGSNQDQENRVFGEFEKIPCTEAAVSYRSNIPIPDIRKYIAAWEKNGLIFQVYKEICPITKRQSEFYTTNTKLAALIASNLRTPDSE